MCCKNKLKLQQQNNIATDAHTQIVHTNWSNGHLPGFTWVS